MPPDADKLRQRRNISTTADDDAHSATHQHQPRILSTVNSLKVNEICIHGVIYDITNFDHPGGDQIYLFGGNDVTVQYHMIHPYHTSKHLEKLKEVGHVSDYVCQYKFDTPFEKEVKKEVFAIVRRGREFGTFGWFFRAVVYLGIYGYLQYLWLFQGTSYALALVYGIIHALIGMNVQHDANHGACSGKNPWINDFFGLGADIIGGDKWLWQEQHWTHHSYTNDPNKDPDGKGAEPLLLFNDYPLNHPKRQWYHRFQIFFYLPVLSGYWLSSVFNPEILDLRQRGALGTGVMHMESDFVKSRRKYAVLMRLVYIYIHVIAPFRQTGSWVWSWNVLGHILVLGASASLALALLFALSHNFEESEREPVVQAEKTGEPVCWFKSQVETSCTYGGCISGYFTGGLNFQIEHHLFPRMSSAWYPYIAPAVRKVCEKHGVRYVYYPWVWQNFFSTVKYIHAAGTGWHHLVKQNPLSGRA